MQVVRSSKRNSWPWSLPWTTWSVTFAGMIPSENLQAQAFLSQQFAQVLPGPVENPLEVGSSCSGDLGLQEGHGLAGVCLRLRALAKLEQDFGTEGHDPGQVTKKFAPALLLHQPLADGDGPVAQRRRPGQVPQGLQRVGLVHAGRGQ